MSQSKFFSNKRHLIVEEISRESSVDKPLSTRLITKKTNQRQNENEHSGTKPKAIQENRLNSYLLSQIKQKSQQNSKGDISYSSKISDKSKKSEKSSSSQVKKNSITSQNTKVTLNTSQTKPSQMTNLSNMNGKLNMDSNRNIKTKLNSQMIQLFLSKKTPTNLQTRAEIKLNSDQQKKTEIPQAQYSQPQVCKQESNKKSKQPDGLQNLLKIQMNLLKKNNVQNIQEKNMFTKKSESLIQQNISSNKGNSILKINDKSTFSRNYQNSQMDVTESNDGFKCYEDTIRLQVLDDESLDQNSQFSLEKQYQFLGSMYIKEQEYSLDAFYFIHFEQKQVNITRKMRAQVIDWMQQVSMEYRFKRETFHLSCYYLDSFLNKQLVSKEVFQLIGLACMQIATKLEVFFFKQEIIPPSIRKLKECAGSTFTVEQINKTEMQVLKTLQYKLNPQTKNVWGNFYLLQWDQYMSENLNYFSHLSPIYFKKPSESSYMVFREFFQILEFTLLEIQSFQYPSRVLVAATIYLVTGRNFGEFDTYAILNRLSNESLQLIPMPNSFNHLFDNFLNRIFSMQLDDIIPAITYLSQFYEHQLCYEFPRAIKENQDQLLEVILLNQTHFEDFLAYQTYNPYNINQICKI